MYGWDVADPAKEDAEASASKAAKHVEQDDVKSGQSSTAAGSAKLAEEDVMGETIACPHCTYANPSWVDECDMCSLAVR